MYAFILFLLDVEQTKQLLKEKNHELLMDGKFLPVRRKEIHPFIDTPLPKKLTL